MIQYARWTTGEGQKIWWSKNEEVRQGEADMIRWEPNEIANRQLRFSTTGVRYLVSYFLTIQFFDQPSCPSHRDERRRSVAGTSQDLSRGTEFPQSV
ncbi:hypothetical protein CKO51_29360 [Rhodopirellula sp. SM50]|nr:hypothetical protein CKO51_29360 [Rhodopirellula sp. SM50]